MNIDCFWPDYTLFPYETSLAKEEVFSLLKPERIECFEDHLLAIGCKDYNKANNLVYFKSYSIDGKSEYTEQYKREHKNSCKNTQNTRYYAHGIHEYKGKFNPQIAKSILNIYGNNCHEIIDPFCGSGTSIFESLLTGFHSTGVDINPLAYKISTIKNSLLHDRIDFHSINIYEIIEKAKRKSIHFKCDSNERNQYLQKWFLPDYFAQIESLREIIANSFCGNTKELLLLIISNIIRDYSCQEPSDLRIRRRISPYPETSFWDRYMAEYEIIAQKINSLYDDFPNNRSQAVIFNNDIRVFCSKKDVQHKYDLALTSPPYALALPYIDTQRLSLVWYNMIAASQIKEMECRLTGSREIMNKEQRNQLLHEMSTNRNNLTRETFDCCISLYNSLSEEDGFRKRETPLLLYQYFSQMSTMFSGMRDVLKPGAFYCLVVGYNKTSIGKYGLIDTPRFLCNEAIKNGFQLIEIKPLEAYQRYGINTTNAIDKEALIVLRNGQSQL